MICGCPSVASLCTVQQLPPCVLPPAVVWYTISHRKHTRTLAAASVNEPAGRQQTLQTPQTHCTPAPQHSLSAIAYITVLLADPGVYCKRSCSVLPNQHVPRVAHVRTGILCLYTCTVLSQPQTSNRSIVAQLPGMSPALPGPIFALLHTSHWVIAKTGKINTPKFSFPIHAPQPTTTHTESH